MKDWCCDSCTSEISYILLLALYFLFCFEYDSSINIGKKDCAFIFLLTGYLCDNFCICLYNVVSILGSPENIVLEFNKELLESYLYLFFKVRGSWLGGRSSSAVTVANRL